MVGSLIAAAPHGSRRDLIRGVIIGLGIVRQLQWGTRKFGNSNKKFRKL